MTLKTQKKQQQQKQLRPNNLQQKDKEWKKKELEATYMMNGGNTTDGNMRISKNEMKKQRQKK